MVIPPRKDDSQGVNTMNKFLKTAALAATMVMNTVFGAFANNGNEVTTAQTQPDGTVPVPTLIQSRHVTALEARNRKGTKFDETEKLLTRYVVQDNMHRDTLDVLSDEKTGAISSIRRIDGLTGEKSVAHFKSNKAGVPQIVEKSNASHYGAQKMYQEAVFALNGTDKKKIVEKGGVSGIVEGNTFYINPVKPSEYAPN
jgi:hypothetical protein